MQKRGSLTRHKTAYMDYFKILLEETFDYKGSKLYLMLILEHGLYSVEIVSKAKSIGKKKVASRKDAEFLFEVISKRLSLYKKFDEAEMALLTAFKFKDFDKLIFVLYSSDRAVSKDMIKKMARKLDFKISIKKNFYEGNRINGAVSIYVYFKESNKSFGKFVGSLSDNDFIFEKNI